MSFYVKSLFFAIPSFFILIFIESIIAKKKGIVVNNAADMVSSLSSGLTNTIRDGLKLSIAIVSYTWLVDSISIYSINYSALSVLIAFIVLLFKSAPYGRHSMSSWGPSMPSRLGWILMESPAVYLMLLFLLFARYSIHWFGVHLQHDNLSRWRRHDSNVRTRRDLIYSQALLTAQPLLRLNYITIIIVIIDGNLS